MGKVLYFFFFFIFHTLLLSHFLFVCLFLVILFYFVSNSNKHFNVCSSEKILLLVIDVFWCSSSGDTLAFAHFGSQSLGSLFLVTLETMCYLSLEVWKNKTHYFFLFDLLSFV